MRSNGLLLAVIVILFSILGCSLFKSEKRDVENKGNQNRQGQKNDEDTGPTARGGKLEFDTKEYVIKEFDVNKDKKPDIFNVYKKGKNAKGEPEEKIFAKKMDLNHDGKIDVWRFYNEKGEVLKEELDLDFDGKIDEADYFQAGIVIKKEIDFQFDEKTDIWKYYDEKGILVKLEEDQDSDTLVDYWEFYTNGVLERIEKDTDKDGKPDVFKRAGDLKFTEIQRANQKFSVKDGIQEVEKTESANTVLKEGSAVKDETKDTGSNEEPASDDDTIEPE